MVCANCDFGSPCACERRRLAASGRTPGEAPLAVTPGADRTEQLRGMLREAANMIASLLLAGGEAPESLQREAEELLATLRAGDT